MKTTTRKTNPSYGCNHCLTKFRAKSAEAGCPKCGGWDVETLRQFNLTQARSKRTTGTLQRQSAAKRAEHAKKWAWERNPAKKKNPGIADMAALANAVFTTMQIHDHMTRKAPKKRTTKAKGRRRNPVVSGQKPVARKRNPETQAEINARMAKVRAARKNPGTRTASSARVANPAKAQAPKPKVQSLRSKINPRKRVTVPSKGRFYLMTIGSGDDTLGVFINDRDGDGISKKFKTVAAAKAYATRNRLTLEKNPADIQVIEPTPTLRKALKANPTAVPNGLFSRYRARRKAKREFGRQMAFEAKARKAKSRARLARKRTAKAASVAWNPAPKKAVAKKNAAPKRVVKKANPVAKKPVTTKKKVNPVVTKKAAPKRRTNPTPTIPRRRTFEMFNGREATKAKPVLVSRLIGRGARVDQLGHLCEIHLEDGTKLKTNPAQFHLVAKNGRLWIVGGKFHTGKMPTRKINPMGRIKNIVYRTWKPHHGDPKGQHYIHEMGEWSGNRPMLSIDNEGFPVIQGGSYKIEARGIVD